MVDPVSNAGSFIDVPLDEPQDLNANAAIPKVVTAPNGETLTLQTVHVTVGDPPEDVELDAFVDSSGNAFLFYGGTDSLVNIDTGEVYTKNGNQWELSGTISPELLATVVKGAESGLYSGASSVSSPPSTFEYDPNQHDPDTSHDGITYIHHRTTGERIGVLAYINGDHFVVPISVAEPPITDDAGRTLIAQGEHNGAIVSVWKKPASERDLVTAQTPQEEENKLMGDIFHPEAQEAQEDALSPYFGSAPPPEAVVVEEEDDDDDILQILYEQGYFDSPPEEPEGGADGEPEEPGGGADGGPPETTLARETPVRPVSQPGAHPVDGIDGPTYEIEVGTGTVNPNDPVEAEPVEGSETGTGDVTVNADGLVEADLVQGAEVEPVPEGVQQAVPLEDAQGTVFNLDGTPVQFTEGAVESVETATAALGEELGEEVAGSVFLEPIPIAGVVVVGLLVVKGVVYYVFENGEYANQDEFHENIDETEFGDEAEVLKLTAAFFKAVAESLLGSAEDVVEGVVDEIVDNTGNPDNDGF